ncbi:type VI secretion system protein TssA [Caballeronia ptereochthonis]
MMPVADAAPCGVDLEYDPEFVVLSAQVAARMEAQYGDFVGVPEPVNWSEVDRACRQLMMRSKDMRLAVLFARCRTRLSGAAGLAEGVGLLDAWLTAFPDSIHPQPAMDEDPDAALEIRMNALQALTDADGLMSDVREIVLARSSATRLQVRDIERAFAHPRPNDALAPESVARQLDDLRARQADVFTEFEKAAASLARIDVWTRERLGAYVPDLSPLTQLLERLAETESKTPVVPAAYSEESSSNDHTPSAPVNDCEPQAGGAEAEVPIAPGQAPARTEAFDRQGALARIREVRRWFERHEPSSPVPLLLRRAEQFVGKPYAQAVKAIPMEFIEQWETDAGEPT